MKIAGLSEAPPMAADKGEVFLFQKITSVWLTGNERPPTAAPVHDGRDKEVALEIGNQCYLVSVRKWGNSAR